MHLRVFQQIAQEGLQVDLSRTKNRRYYLWLFYFFHLHLLVTENWKKEKHKRSVSGSDKEESNQRQNRAKREGRILTRVLLQYSVELQKQTSHIQVSGNQLEKFSFTVKD